VVLGIGINLCTPGIWPNDKKNIAPIGHLPPRNQWGRQPGVSGASRRVQPALAADGLLMLKLRVKGYGKQIEVF
jgi:hypothetical protein